MNLHLNLHDVLFQELIYKWEIPSSQCLQCVINKMLMVGEDKLIFHFYSLQILKKDVGPPGGTQHRGRS